MWVATEARILDPSGAEGSCKPPDMGAVNKLRSSGRAVSTHNCQPQISFKTFFY